MPTLQSLPVRWLIAILGFPIGGFIGHLVGGPAATIPSALISGAIAGGIIGLGQGSALKLRRRLWSCGPPSPLSASVSRSRPSPQSSVRSRPRPKPPLLGAIAGLVLGVGQAVVLQRNGVPAAWLWVPASGLAWAAGWFVTASAGIALEAGWPVYGMSGAVVSQVITGIVVWRAMEARPAASCDPA